MALLAALVAIPGILLAAAAEDQIYHPAVATGRHFSLFLDPFKKEVLGAGRNHFGQLGAIDTESVETPTRILFPMAEQPQPKVIAAAAGASHSVFLTDEGGVWVSGWNRYGQLAHDPQSRPFVTTPINIITGGVRAVAAGYAHSLFLTESGRLQGVGWNRYGQLGLGDTIDRTRVSNISLSACTQSCTIQSIATGYDTSFALTEGGEVWAFGNNFGGQLGTDARNIEMSPILVPVQGVTAVTAGTAHTLFQQGGTSVGTGANFAGQLGDGTTTNRLAPVAVSFGGDGVGVMKVFAGGDSSGIIGGAAQELFGFGSNLDGQLGLGDQASATEPVKIDVPEEGRRFRSVAIGAYHGLFLDSFGLVFTSGANLFGELGANSTIDRKTLQTDFSLTALTTTSTTSTVTIRTQTTTTTNKSDVTTSTLTMTSQTTTKTNESGVTTSTSHHVTTRGPSAEEPMDWTTIMWATGAIITLLGLITCVVAKGEMRPARSGRQSRGRAPLEDDDREGIAMAS